MPRFTKSQINRLAGDMIAELKQNRWIAQSELRIDSRRSLLAFQTPSGQVALELFDSKLPSDVVRRKRVEESASRVAWLWRAGHPGYISRPDQAAKLSERLKGPAKSRSRLIPKSWEVRS